MIYAKGSENETRCRCQYQYQKRSCGVEWRDIIDGFLTASWRGIYCRRYVVMCPMVGVVGQEVESSSVKENITHDQKCPNEAFTWPERNEKNITRESFFW